MPRGFLDVDIASTAVVGAWLGFAIWATYSVFAQGRVQIYAENGPIEFMQACLLALACAIYLVTLLVQKRPDKLILLFCCLLCYGFVVRELDVETFDLPRVTILIGSGKGRNATLVVALAAIGLYAALFNFSYYRKAAAEFARSRPGILLMTAGLFLVIADLIEKSKPIAHHVFAEEMVELFAYVLILLSSITATRRVSQR